MWQQEKLGWSLLHKRNYTQVIYMPILNLRVERRAAMGDNFLPSVHDQRSLLLPAWQDWLLEGNLALFILAAVAQRRAQ